MLEDGWLAFTPYSEFTKYRNSAEFRLSNVNRNFTVSNSSVCNSVCIISSAASSTAGSAASGATSSAAGSAACR